MKKRIVSMVISFMFLICNIVYASSEAFSDVEFKYSDNGIMTVSGKLLSGEDRLIYMDVTDSENKSVYTDIVYSTYGGEFIFVINIEDWKNDEYLFSFSDDEANRYNVSKTKPFKESDTDVGYEILNNEIWFSDEKSIETNKNVIEIEFSGAELIKGNVNESLYDVEGLPKGIKTIAEVSEDALMITFYGKADKAVTEEIELTVYLKPGIITTSGGKELTVDGIFAIPSDIAKSIRYSSGEMSFKMKNNTQAADNTSFEVTLLRDVIVSGKLEKGVHFDYNDENIDGLEIKAYVSESENNIKFELTGTAKNKITKDTYIEDFVIKSIVADGAKTDSIPQKIKIIAKKGTQSSGSSGGSSSGGIAAGSGSIGGASGTTSDSLLITGGAGNKVQDIITTDKNNIEATVPEKDVKFTDMLNHWAENEIKILAGKGIVNGVGNNMFAPDRSVTRAEFLKMIVLAFGFDANGAVNCFEDVSSNDWFNTYVLAGLKNGLISEDSKFRPNDTITRQEMSKIATEAVLKYVTAPEILISAKTYVDYGDISDWAVGYVEKGSTLGLFKGDNYQRFLPKNNTTRAAAGVVIFRAMSYCNFG